MSENTEEYVAQLEGELTELRAKLGSAEDRLSELEPHVEHLGNIAGLRKSAEARIAELEADVAAKSEYIGELEPVMHRALVIDAGFDPDNSKKGIRLRKDLESGAVKVADDETPVSAVVRHAFDEYEWEPEGSGRPLLSANEQSAMSSANRLAGLSAVAVSDTPPTLDQASAEALARGDVKSAISAQNQKLLQAMRGN